MPDSRALRDPEARVQELLALFSDTRASAAYLLCDRHDPAKIAYRIVAPGLSTRDLTYGELKQQSERFAAALHSLGIGPGDRVATLMGKSANLLIAIMGIWRLGAVHVPLFTAFAPPAIAFRLQRSRARVVICDEAQQQKLVPSDDIPAHPPWHLITTATDDDVPPEAIGFSRHNVTNFTGAPTVFRSLRASGLSPPPELKLRCASAAGEPLTPEVNDWAKIALRVMVHDHYGQSEHLMLINNHHHPAVQRPLKPGSMGQSMPGWTAVVLKTDRDELAPAGEVTRLALDMTCSALACFPGHLEEPEKNAEKFSANGRYFITGDVGRRDDEGNFYFSSRDDDVILMSGYRIGPFEIESVMLTHPAVSECAVVAVPDSLRGEVIVSAVVLRQDAIASPALTEELQSWVTARYAAHAYPRRIHYAESLPKTPSGKIQRFVVRQQLRMTS